MPLTTRDQVIQEYHDAVRQLDAAERQYSKDKDIDALRQAEEAYKARYEAYRSFLETVRTQHAAKTNRLVAKATRKPEKEILKEAIRQVNNELKVLREERDSLKELLDKNIKRRQYLSRELLTDLRKRKKGDSHG